MKTPVEFKEGALHFGLDSNDDGENSINGKLNLSEAIGEAISKGTQVEGAKVADFKFEGTKLKLKVDSDKDGQSLLELELDLIESFDEIKAATAKKQ